MARANPETEADEWFEAGLDAHGVPYLYEPDWRVRFGVETAANPEYLIEPDGRGARHLPPPAL